jgi:hypothetical protein
MTPLSSTIPCLEERSLGQSVYDLIISDVTDRSTLYSWQRVSRACYYTATPRLYNTIDDVVLETASELCSFVTGVTGADPNTRLLPPKHEVFKGLIRGLKTIWLLGTASDNNHFDFAREVDKDHPEKDGHLFRICFAKRSLSHYPPLQTLDWWQEPEDVEKRGAPLTTVLDKDVIVSFSTSYPGPDDHTSRGYGVLHFGLYEPHSMLGDERLKFEIKS